MVTSVARHPLPRRIGRASCLTSNTMKKYLAMMILMSCLLGWPNLATTVETTPEPLKVEFISPKEGETVHGDITIEAKVNERAAVDYCEFYIQEPGARDRYGWKDYAPPYFWGGDGQTLDTAMFDDGLASVVVSCQTKDKKPAVFESRVHFVIDNGKPFVEILSPKDASIVAGRIVISFIVKDIKGMRKKTGIRTVYVYIDGGNYQLLENPPYDGIVWDTCLLQSGLHSITVTVVDDRALSKSRTVIVDVKNTGD